MWSFVALLFETATCPPGSTLLSHWNAALRGRGLLPCHQSNVQAVAVTGHRVHEGTEVRILPQKRTPMLWDPTVWRDIPEGPTEEAASAVGERQGGSQWQNEEDGEGTHAAGGGAGCNLPLR